MDIHLPKPFHNWREFAKEYGIIVLGVLTALGLEQAIEAIHHRNEVQEAREALNREMAHNLTSLQQTLDQRPCAFARLDEIERWKTSWEEGHPLKLAGPVRFPNYIIFGTAVWKVTAGDAVGRMPLEERTNLAILYASTDNSDDLRNKLTERWIDLANLSRARRLSDDQLLQIDNDIQAIRALYSVLASNQESLLEIAKKVKIEPLKEEISPWLAGQIKAVCTPLLAS